LREAVEGLGEYDWIIFSSPNSVEFFFEEFFRQYPDIRSLGFLKIAAMGPGTAQRLRELHLEVDLQPEEAVAESMVKAFDKAMDVANLRILWPRADLARDVLSKKLEELGAIVDSVEAYRNVIEDSDPNGIVQRLTSEGADCVVFASSSSATNFAKLIDVPKLRAAFPKLRFASIGPITTETAEKLGMPISIQPADHTMPALIEAIRVKLS
jgi:uroporphyrinogen III methyltransferase/synthase